MDRFLPYVFAVRENDEPTELSVAVFAPPAQAERCARITLLLAVEQLRRERD